MNTPREILKHYWGHDRFRPLQEDIIESALSGKDVLALLPTGGGKSLCFQIPGLLNKGTTLVISPLIALMKDQVEQLNKKNIKAYALFSGLSHREIDLILDNCAYGDVKFLYVSPERVQSDFFQERLKKININLIAIDEAHCISLWGYDFRPPYLQLNILRELLPQIPMMALTATATSQVIYDIIFQLKLEEPKIFQQSFERSNISYSVRKSLKKHEDSLRILSRVTGPAIVYANNRKETRELSDFLNANGIKASFYHAGLSASERSTKQQSWIQNKTRVVVATNAFGMGIDKPDVRMVIHTHIPNSPEAYYQEAGRGGRDGNRSYSVILYSDNDKQYLQKEWDASNPDPDYIKRVYQAVSNFLKIGVGSSENASYPFLLSDFCRNFELDSRKVFFTLKKLENSGLIQLNEPFEHPSRLWLLTSRTDLYKFQIENKSFDPLIKALLRLYGGELFTQFIKINENQIAKLLNADRSTVIKLLDILHKQGLADYDMQKLEPHITFIRQRYDASHLPIDFSMLKNRKENEKTKIDTMIQYVENEVRCRNQILLEYFGEVKYDPCGICDTCLKHKQDTKHSHEINYKEQILELLSEKAMDLDKIEETLSTVDTNFLDNIIREMIDENLIRYNEHWQLEKVNGEQ